MRDIELWARINELTRKAKLGGGLTAEERAELTRLEADADARTAYDVRAATWPWGE